MKKVAVFTGAGISAESGIPTFRDKMDGLWEKYDTDVVAHANGWKTRKEDVLEFHNELRKQIYDCEPNDAHRALKDLEDHANVTIVTQNIDDLHERAKSSKIFHVHGELLKCRSTVDESLVYDCRGSIDVGDKCEKGSQLKPDTVLFGEMPRYYYDAVEAFAEADYVMIIGTSLQISYTLTFFDRLGPDKRIYFIDPQPVKYLNSYGLNVEYIEKGAVEGVREIVKEIVSEIKEGENLV